MASYEEAIHNHLCTSQVNTFICSVPVSGNQPSRLLLLSLHNTWLYQRVLGNICLRHKNSFQQQLKQLQQKACFFCFFVCISSWAPAPPCLNSIYHRVQFLINCILKSMSVSLSWLTNTYLVYKDAKEVLMK